MEKKNNRLPVYDLEGNEVDKILLDESLFDGEVNTVLLYEAKKMYEANSRTGNASTKTRSEVRGGGAKPWRQKGTGRARVGSSRNPLWRHGGIVFGPRPRDFGYSMPKKAVRKALLSGLNARLSEDGVKAVVKIEFSGPKTKVSRQTLDKLGIRGKALVVVDQISDNVLLSFRNLRGVSLKEGRNVNARDILLHDRIVIEKEAFEKLAERLR